MIPEGNDKKIGNTTAGEEAANDDEDSDDDYDEPDGNMTLSIAIMSGGSGSHRLLA